MSNPIGITQRGLENDVVPVSHRLKSVEHFLLQIAARRRDVDQQWMPSFEHRQEIRFVGVPFGLN